MAKLVARLLATAALWVRIQTSLKKYKLCDISKGLAQHTQAHQKNIQKKLIINFSCLLLVLVGEEITLELLVVFHTQGGEEIVLVLQDEVPVVVCHVGGQYRPEEGHLSHYK